MKAILSGLIVDAKGKLGDMVAAHNHYGLFFRERRDTPPNHSPYWISIRDQTIALSVEWRTLTQSVRDSWNQGAKLFRRSDSLGQAYYQTGLNFYVGTNINRFLCGLPTIYTPPTPLALPYFTSLSLSANSAIPEKIISFTPAIDTAYKVKLWLTKAINAGINRAFHQYRLLELLDNSFLSGSNIESTFVSRFTSSGNSGDKIFVKAIFVHKASGLVGQPIYATSIIF